MTKRLTEGKTRGSMWPKQSIGNCRPISGPPGLKGVGVDLRKEMTKNVNEELERLDFKEICQVYKFCRWIISEVPGEEKKQFTKPRYK